MKRLGLYLHIPFCLGKCNYCDFCSFAGQSEETIAAYVSALCRDLREKSGLAGDYLVDSVYFGGGTPTLLSEGQFEEIFDTLHAAYHIEKDAEISTECNPATGGEDLFSALFSMGVNRVSVGLQSIHKDELAALGRLHDFADFAKTVDALQRVGFSNVGVDLMFGIPHQTTERYLVSIKTVTAMGLTHVSAYGLILEEGTPFWEKKGELALPDEDAEREMYLRGAEALERAGFLQYEISNFARRGYESRHNLKYWQGEEFLGFGPAAYSDFAGERFGNSRDLAAYIRGETGIASCERPAQEERAEEAVMLGLRLTEGISLTALQQRFGEAFAARISHALERYLSMGLVRKTRDGYALTREGFYVSNTILSDILDFRQST